MNNMKKDDKKAIANIAWGVFWGMMAAWVIQIIVGAYIGFAFAGTILNQISR